MESIKALIYEYKEWIWYGLIPLIAIIISIIGLRKKDNAILRSQKQKMGNNSTGYQAGGDIKINDK